VAINHVEWDVREPAPASLCFVRWDWIFNFAAVHREPGHAREEYFETNIPGARNVCALAELTGCNSILFTASIAVYGPTRGATTEESPKYPTTAYGISKLLAEEIHRGWLTQGSAGERKLVICRPGVIYGPGEQGNIRRMVQAIRKGFFFFPGDRRILKSYGYIEGLLDSFEFMSRQAEAVRSQLGARSLEPIIYNYVESPTEPLEALAGHITRAIGKRGRFMSIPLGLLVLAAAGLQVLTRGKSGLHPARVRKAATPTQIVPAELLRRGFVFRYDFKSSLIDWQSKEPQLWGERA
jgi:nucleoside-diphosphate-sugar epimerase